MVSERDSYLDADDTTVSVTQSLHDAQAPSHDDGDAHEDGRAVLREAVQVTSHGRVVSCAVHERPVSSMGNRPAPARRLPRWPRMWMPRMKSRKRKTSAGAVRATATQMVWFPFTTCRLIYNIGCLRHSMDRKDE